MKRLQLAALWIGLSSAFAQGATTTKAAAVVDSDIPVTVGIQPVLPLVTPGGQLGHWGVGNGGDWMRINFARARDYAGNVVLRINPASLSRIQSPDLLDWIMKNQKFLAADIMQTEHVWVNEEKPTCAFTVPPGAGDKVPTSNPIQFSYPTCRIQLKCSRDATEVDPNAPMDFLKVAQLLIHEAAHHFKADETMADMVAISIIDAWQSGLMDSTPLGLTNAPAQSQKHSAVWTGETMVVVGGYQEEYNIYPTKDSPMIPPAQLNSVTSYDPVKGVWTDLKPPEWFQARREAIVIWTGTEVFIWGGYNMVDSLTTVWLQDGALYNPATQVWTAVGLPKDFWKPKSSSSAMEFPKQTGVWTGDKAIIWGGIGTDGLPMGGVFDPAKRSWTAMKTDGAAPQTHFGHSAVWTGKSMIVWGGYTINGALYDYGATYDPVGNTWTAIASGAANGAPTPRGGHQTVWTGNSMVVISGGGGSTSTDLNSTGGIYYPSTDTWTTYKSEMLIERIGHRVVWNGEEVLLVGGQSKRLSTYFGEVFAFNPATLRWRMLPGSAAPLARSYASIVWTGSSALVWGGTIGKALSGPKTLRSGAQYYP